MRDVVLARRSFGRVVGCLALLALWACQRPVNIHAGDVARLAVLDLASALQLVNGDRACGFESEAAVATQELSSAPGTDGTVTRRVRDCVIDLDDGEPRWPYFTCDQNAGSARGKIRFSGTRTLRGRLTGTPAVPVIPAGKEGLIIEIEHLEFEGFEVLRLDNPGHLTIVRGAVSGRAQSVLAASKADGFCSAPTPDSRLEDLDFRDMSVRFHRLTRTTEHTIEGSSLTAVNGRVGDVENHLRGTLTLDGVPTEIPLEGQAADFDTDYRRDTFEAAFACADSELQLPLDAECGSVDDLVATNASRLAAVTLTTVVQLLDEDKACGFGSSSVQAGAISEGRPGERGTVTQHVEECTLELPKGAKVASDCLGRADVVSGRITVSARKTYKGVLTGDPRAPVLMESDEAVAFDVRVGALTDVSMQIGDRLLEVHSGALTGRLSPRVAVSASYGVCSVPTRIAQLSGVDLSNARVRLSTPRGAFEAIVDRSNIEAISGPWKGQENVLWGTLTTQGRTFEISPSAPTALDPAYDSSLFQASWQCAPDLAQPISFECSKASVDSLLASNVSRFSGSALTTIVQLLQEDEVCGFPSPSVVAAATVQGLPGDQGSIVYRVDGCTIELPPGTLMAADCLGQRDTVSGQITVSATKTMRGLVTGDPSRPIVLDSDDGVTFEVTRSALHEFEVRLGGQFARFHTGSLTGQSSPRVAQSINRGVCSVPTGIAQLSRINLSDAALSIGVSGGNTLATRVERSDLFAISGAWQGRENALWGRITTASGELEIPASAPIAFDTGYEPAVFADTWRCDPNLAQPVSFDCASSLPLPETAARLSVAALGAVTSLIERDAACGFSSASVLSSAQRTGAVGEPGATGTFTVPTCQIQFTEPTVVAEDCHGKKTTMQGSLTFRATKTMTGYNTGDPSRPILPTGRDAILFEIEVDLADFVFSVEPRSGPSNRLIVDSGTLAGSVRPRLALDRVTGACSKATPITFFQGVTFRSATRLGLELGGNHFGALVSEMSLGAQSGTRGELTNRIGGTLQVGGRTYTFPIRGSSDFDPDYDPVAFDASYQSCDADLVVARDEEDCDFKAALAQQAARGLSLAVASLAGTLSGDADCGLDIKDSQRAPSDVDGRVGSIGSATWTAPPRGQGTCNYNFARTHVQSRDCLGRTRYLGGNFAMSATLLVRGRIRDMRGTLYMNPTSPDGPTDYTLNVPGFQDLYVAEVDPDGALVQSLWVEGGDLRALLNPIMGEDRDPAFTYLVPTPVTRFVHASLTGNTRVTMRIGGMTFHSTLSGATISGFSGNYNGETNHIAGTVELEGTSRVVDGVLDPAYDQGTFDDRYRCNRELERVVPTRFP